MITASRIKHKEHAVRKINRILLLLLLLAVIFPFTFPWKDGKPMLSWSDLQLPGMPSLKLPELADISLPGKEEEAREPHQPVKLYRWQTPDGSMQFSNEPPPSGVRYEVVEVNPDANLIQGQPLAAAEEESVTPEEGTAPAASLPSPLTVSPDEAMQLFEDAREIREMSEERLRQHEALTQ
jgi:hypothetical protein